MSLVMAVFATTLTFPVPGGPANNMARPAIFFDLINSTTTPHAYIVKRDKIYEWTTVFIIVWL